MFKKIMAIVCTIFMLGSMTAFALEADTALYPTVENGDFEDSNVVWSTGTIDTTQKHGGSGSLRIDAGTGLVFSNYTLNFDFRTDITYTLTCWVNNPNQKNGVVLVEAFNAENTNLGEMYRMALVSVGTSGWQMLTKDFTVPVGTIALKFTLGNYAQDSTSGIYFDDISIEETPIIKNGRMDILATDGFPNQWERGLPNKNSDNTTFGKENFYVTDANGAHSGTTYAKINTAAGELNPNPNIYIVLNSLEGNKNYVLSFWFKWTADASSEVVAYPRVGVGDKYFYYAAASNYMYFGGDASASVAKDTWVKCTHYFSTGATLPTTVYLTLYGMKGATVCYDTVELRMDTTKTMIHEASGAVGTDVTNLATLPANTTLYAKGRFIPTTDSASAVLVAAVFDESTGKKQLKDVQVVPYSTTDGTPATLEAAVKVENPAQSAVEVYMWDSTNGLSPLLKKVRTSAAQ